MKPLLSEFSYGYALTEELASGAFGALTGAPVFPSLFAEGALGYDIELPFHGAPLFLQFKLSDKMVRNTAGEAAHFGVPYFRFYLRPRRHSIQHDLLQNWQASGEEVYYAAPLFHTHAELNAAYTAHAVLASSVLFEPLDIDLPDDDEHYVSFSGAHAYFLRCSDEPAKVEKKLVASQVAEGISARLRSRRKKIDRKFFVELSAKIIAFAKERRIDVQMFENAAYVRKKGDSLVAEASLAAFLTRSIFGAELFIAKL